MSNRSDVAAFEESDPLEALFSLGQRRVELMVKRRLARWRDESRMWWSYSALGAVLVCLGFFTQLLGALTQFWRVNKRPIGSHLPPR